MMLDQWQSSRLARSARSIVVASMLCLATAVAPLAADPGNVAVPSHSPLNEEVIRIPGEAPPAVTLQVTIMHPDGPGPYPLAIMNHGATGRAIVERGERYRLSNSTFYFLSRGYAVALPMMRGFAASGGEIYHFGCDLAGAGIANAKDIRAVIRYLGNDRRFDTSRVVVAGQSMGGWNALALGSLGVPNVKALVNFNGGLRFSDCNSGDSALLTGAAQFGAATKIPSVWFYGENDELFPVALWRGMYDRYIRSGGHAELADVGVVMKNSHNFLSYPEVLPIWTSKVDALLASVGMPFTPVYPHYLPMVFPPATHFARLNDVAAVPYLSDKARDLYRKFLEAPFPRAFVVTESGSASSQSNGYDPLGRALEICQKTAARCGVYAVDDHVVWKPLPPQERAYTIMAKADQTSTIDFATRLNPDCTARTFARFRVAQPPAHGQVGISQQAGPARFPDGSPFAICNKAPVQGVLVTYTPAKGFNGNDYFAFAEDVPGGSETMFRMTVTVK
jgi:dienelactone hydrolase